MNVFVFESLLNIYMVIMTSDERKEQILYTKSIPSGE